MRTLSSYFRGHHVVVAGFVVAFPAAVGSMFEWGSAPSALGWSLAVGWTMSAMLESLALAGDRWKRETMVPTSVRVFSFVMLALVLLFASYTILMRIYMMRWWYGLDASPAFLSLLGGGYLEALHMGSQYLFTCAGGVGAMLVLRTLWRRDGPSVISRPWLAVVAFLAIVWGLIMTGIANSLDFDLRHLGFDVFNIKWSLVYIHPMLPTVLTVMTWVFLRTGKSWIGRLTGLQTGWTIITGLAICLVPFVVGLTMYGSSIEHTDRMTSWYMLSVAVLPFVMWSISRYFLRSVPPAGANG